MGTTLRSFVIVVFLLVLSLIAISVLAILQTKESVQSVWFVVPPWWILFPLSIAAAAAAFERFLSFRQHIVLAIALLFIVLTVTVIVFPLGYGFDLYSHETVMRAIVTQGTFEPITPLYLGYYMIVIAITKTLSLFLPSVETFTILRAVNQSLVPVASALFIPLFVAREIKHSNSPWSLSALMAPALLLPWWYFTHSTPQNLSYLFLLATAFAVKRQWMMEAFFWAVMALVTHVVSGALAAMLVVIMALVGRSRFHWRTLAIVTLFALATVMMMIVVLLPFLSTITVRWPVISFRMFPIVGIDARLTILYTLERLRWIVVVAFVLWSWWQAWCQRTRDHFSVALLAGSAAAMLLALAAAFIQIAGDSSAALGSSSYTVRLIYAGLMMSIPLMVSSLSTLPWHRWDTLLWAPRLACVVVLTALMGMGIYRLYPVADEGYAVSRGWNMSQWDLEAVRKIDGWADDDTIVVLVDQPLAAAAIRTQGFRRTVTLEGGGSLFAYSTPNQPQLYQWYLKFLTQPVRETIAPLAVQTNADTIIVVIHRYWTNSERIVRRAKESADEMTAIGPDVMMFRYRFVQEQ